MQSSRIFSHLPDRYLQMARVNRGRLIIHERDERLHFLYVQTFLWVGGGRGRETGSAGAQLTVMSPCL